MSDIIGYARVSTKEQNIEPQINILRQNGATKIFYEKVSGKKANRPELMNAIEWAREGDTLLVTRIDRMARNVEHLHKMVRKLHDKGVSFKSIQFNIDTSGSMGQLILTMLGAIAQFETDIRAERQREGIDAALRNGAKFGRKPKLNKNQRLSLYREKVIEGWTVSDIMNKYSISRTHIYYVIKDMEEKKEHLKI